MLTDDETETYMIEVEAVLYINDDAQMSSKIVEVFTDPCGYEIDWEKVYGVHADCNGPNGWLMSLME